MFYAGTFFLRGLEALPYWVEEYGGLQNFKLVNLEDRGTWSSPSESNTLAINPLHFCGGEISFEVVPPPCISLAGGFRFFVVVDGEETVEPDVLEEPSALGYLLDFKTGAFWKASEDGWGCKIDVLICWLCTEVEGP